MRKKIAFLLTMVLIALAGCSGNNGAEFGNKQKNTLLPETLKIVNYSCGFSGLNTEEGQESEQDKWVDAMSDKYGVDILLYANQKDDITIAKQYQNPTGQGLPFDGVWFYPLDKIAELAKEGSILPIDEYLKDNTTWNRLPKQMQECFTIDGHVYALPLGYSPDPSVRLIRKDWLKKLGMNTPTTLSELKEALSSFRSASGLSGEKKVIPLVCDNATNDLEDIWNAFGITMLNQGIRWDDKLNCFIDQMLTPEAERALNYIKALYSEGLMSPIYQNGAETMAGVKYDNESAIKEGFAGSILGKVKDTYAYDLAKNTLENTEKWELDYTNISDQNLIKSFYGQLPVLTDGEVVPVQNSVASYAGYVLGKDTQDPGKTINFLVDMLYATKQSFLDCFLGTNDLWSITSKGKVVFNVNDEDTEQKYHMAGLNYYVMGMYDESMLQYEVKGDKSITAQMDLANELTADRLSTAAQLIQSGNLVFLPANHYMLLQDKENVGAEILNSILCEVLTNPNVSAKQGLEDYRKKCKEAGMQAYLDKINKSLGTRSCQQY